MGSLRSLLRPQEENNERKKKPIEVFFEAVSRTFTHSHPNRPGAVIEKLSKADRRALQRLTSDELSKYRAF
jgi:hypothetical protein